MCIRDSRGPDPGGAPGRRQRGRNPGQNRGGVPGIPGLKSDVKREKAREVISSRAFVILFRGTSSTLAAASEPEPVPGQRPGLDVYKRQQDTYVPASRAFFEIEMSTGKDGNSNGD